MDKKILALEEQLRLSQSVVPPRLVQGSTGWYFVFYQLDPVADLVVRHRKSYNLNRIRKTKSRKAKAGELLQVLEQLFQHGYPYVNGRVEYDFGAFVAAKRAELDIITGAKLEKTLSEAIQFVVDLKCQSDRNETVRTYSNAGKRILEWVAANKLAELPISKFGHQHAQAFMDYQRLRVGNNTYNNYRAQMIALWSAMKSRKLVADNPFVSTSKVPKAKKTRRPFTNEEAQVVLEYIWESGDYWMFMLILLHLGEMVRRTECYRLRFRHFNLQEGYIKLEESDTKNRKESIITIPKDLMVFFLDDRFTQNPTNYLLFGRGMEPHATLSAGEGSYRNKHRIVLQRLQKAGKLANIEGLSLYSWKDTGMTALAKTLTPFQLRDHARHSSIDMSLKYYHADFVIPEVRQSNFTFMAELLHKKRSEKP